MRAGAHNLARPRVHDGSREVVTGVRLKGGERAQITVERREIHRVGKGKIHTHIVYYIQYI